MSLEESRENACCTFIEDTEKETVKDLSISKGNYLWAFAPCSPLRHDALAGTEKGTGLGFWGSVFLVAQPPVHCPSFTVCSIHTSVSGGDNDRVM